MQQNQSQETPGVSWVKESSEEPSVGQIIDYPGEKILCFVIPAVGIPRNEKLANWLVSLSLSLSLLFSHCDFLNGSSPFPCT